MFNWKAGAEVLGFMIMMLLIFAMVMWILTIVQGFIGFGWTAAIYITSILFIGAAIIGFKEGK